MQVDRRTALRKIRTFPSLVRFLRDDMGWPIATEDFDDLTFEYTPEELGIDPKNAAKIEEIKRLRPLVPHQPWGIFFVKFEPKRLPVVALRRILSQVVLKKRASGKEAERKAWEADDLLFVSNHGEGGERQISFAHFSRAGSKQDLPTLKVLGWDNLDTPLHLEDVAEKLTTTLAWPADDANVEKWRDTWRSAFTLRHREVITTSRALSIRLAELARAIRDRILTALSIETEEGHLSTLMKAFKDALVHDLDSNGFADMYAQTIAYGLLSARVANPKGKTADDLPAQMPVTNPFLKELMETFLHVGGRRGKVGGPEIDFDELGVSEVVELLDDANMEAVVLDFGDRNPQEDPVIHFYELFLKEYDAKKRMQRGVFYTPRPVVSYIVRSVDELLRTEFGLEDGLADTATWGEMAERHKDLKVPGGVSPDQDFVQILDPATGTGTFLVEGIDLIRKTLVAKWKAQGHADMKIEALWNEYVPRHLLPRLHGYELLMAPYAIAHLKIGLKLRETGYRFGSDERARIYLTNALEASSDFGQMQLEGILPALAHEAQAVSEIKQNQRFTVVIGNPPYSARSYNLTPSAREMVKRYKFIKGEPIREKGALQLEKNLNDDYVKFLSLSQLLTAALPASVGVITNHSFLENPTLRGLRWHLLDQYTWLRFLDLGGNIARREKAEDDNVFDISQGVAISLFSSPPGRVPVHIEMGRLRGSRAEKYTALSHATHFPFEQLEATPVEPLFLFRIESAGLRSEYDPGVSLMDLLPLNSTGIKTHRDGFCIDFDLEPLRKRIADLVSGDVSDAQIREKYGLEDTYGWSLKACRAKLRSDPGWENNFGRVLYRPFDWRHIYFSPHVVELARMEVSENFLHGDNLGLVFMRQVAGDEIYSHFAVTRDPVDNRCFYSNRGTMSFAPLYLSKSRSPSDGLFANSTQGGRAPNIAKDALRRFRFALSHDSPAAMTPEALLAYSYAVFHSPSYRTRYADFLKIDFPRVPLPGSLELFQALARFGNEFVDLHLMESPKLDNFITSYSGPKHPEVERVGWSDETVWLDAGKTTAREGHTATIPGHVGFGGVPKKVWDFHIGGYQVCHKWLSDRKGRKLSKDDIDHYQKIVVAISETIRLMGEIDEGIESHGGWPAAFLADAGQEPATPTPLRFIPRIVKPTPEDRYVTAVPLVPLKVAAGGFGDPQHLEDEGWEWVAVKTRRRLRPGMFVAQVVGKSMEPEIPDGSYCLFASPVTGTRQGKTVLVQLRDALDPETGERYTVKRYESEKVEEDGSWRHSRITLKPTNPDFGAIELSEEDQVQVIAELIEVLRSEEAPKESRSRRRPRS